MVDADPIWPDWTPDQSRQAMEAEGWDIFECDDVDHPPFELQRIDFPEEGAPKLEDDMEAWRLVREGAAAGKPLHVAALRFLELRSPVEHYHVVHGVSYRDEPYDPNQDTARQ